MPRSLRFDSPPQRGSLGPPAVRANLFVAVPYCHLREIAPKWMTAHYTSSGLRQAEENKCPQRGTNPLPHYRSKPIRFRNFSFVERTIDRPTKHGEVFRSTMDLPKTFVWRSVSSAVRPPSLSPGAEMSFRNARPVPAKVYEFLILAARVERCFLEVPHAVFVSAIDTLSDI